MAKNYRSITPIQQFDPTACWAASLEWWAGAVGGGRGVVTQMNLLNLYLSYWDSSNPDTNPNYGTVSRGNLIAIIQDPRWRMDCFTVQPNDFDCYYINRKMKYGPCLLGYMRPGIGKHVVVAYGASDTHIAVMDPDGAKFIGHSLAHYKTTELIIGSPRQ